MIAGLKGPVSTTVRGNSVSNAQLPFQKIDQLKSIRETVTESLRTAIILGDLDEGRVYSAPSLAEALGVSATPVREAMMDLTREGLVSTVKNRGFLVSEMTPEDLEEHTQVRQLLEAPAMRAIAGKIPSDHYPALREIADRIVKGAADGDLQTYLQADRDFHGRLIEYTGNKHLARLTTQLRSQTRLKALRKLANEGVLVESAAEHHELLDLLEAGSADAAHDLTIKHIGHTSTLWATGDKSSQQEPAPVDLLFHLRKTTDDT